MKVIDCIKRANLAIDRITWACSDNTAQFTEAELNETAHPRASQLLSELEALASKFQETSNA